MGFISETTVKAVRKQHRCDICSKPILVGEPAIRWAGTTDGDFGTCIFHPDCRAAECEYNREAGGYYDEWFRLADEGTKEHREWLRRDHPVVAERIYGPTLSTQDDPS